MKLTWQHYFVIFTATGPLFGAAGYYWDSHWFVKLGVSLCVLYVGWQISWGMFRNPLWPLIAFGVGSAYGWWREHPGLEIAAYGLLLAVAVDVVMEAIALLRGGDEETDGNQEPSG
jgi:hypothetical protein